MANVENEIAAKVVDAALKVHRTLGPGLLESVHQAALAYELRRRGLHISERAPISIRYEGLEMPNAYRADLIVEGKVIVELKSAELTHLRLSGLKLGLLINFGSSALEARHHPPRERTRR